LGGIRFSFDFKFVHRYFLAKQVEKDGNQDRHQHQAAQFGP
jgi:hypothetical protein